MEGGRGEGSGDGSCGGTGEGGDFGEEEAGRCLSFGGGWRADGGRKRRSGGEYGSVVMEECDRG